VIFNVNDTPTEIGLTRFEEVVAKSFSKSCTVGYTPSVPNRMQLSLLEESNNFKFD